MKNLSLNLKILSGFAFLIIIASLLGLNAIWNMNKVETQSMMLAQEYVPEVGLAVEIRGAVNRLMFEMRGYGLTEDKAFYLAAQKELKTLESALEEASRLEADSSNLKMLKGQIQRISSQVDTYKALIKETMAINAKLAENRTVLDSFAEEYMTNSNALLAAENEKLKVELGEHQARQAKQLLERQAKISLVNDIINLGNLARIGTYKSQATRSPQIMEDAVKIFSGVDPLLEDLQAITRTDETLKIVNHVKAAGGNYRTVMVEFLDNWLALQDLRTKGKWQVRLWLKPASVLPKPVWMIRKRFPKRRWHPFPMRLKL